MEATSTWTLDSHGVLNENSIGGKSNENAGDSVCFLCCERSSTCVAITSCDCRANLNGVHVSKVFIGIEFVEI